MRTPPERLLTNFKSAGRGMFNVKCPFQGHEAESLHVFEREARFMSTFPQQAFQAEYSHPEMDGGVNLSKQ